MRTNSFIRILAVTLILCLTVQLMPVSAMETIKELLSGSGRDPAQSDSQWDESLLSTQDAELTITGEDLDRREENVKHFRLSNGSYIAAVYPFPVHYEQDGQWVDFDHTLSLPQETGPAARAAVASSPYDISFGLSARTGNLLHFDSGVGAISLSPVQDNLLLLPPLASVMEMENGSGVKLIPYVDTSALERHAQLQEQTQQPSVAANSMDNDANDAAKKQEPILREEGPQITQIPEAAPESARSSSSENVLSAPESTLSGLAPDQQTTLLPAATPEPSAIPENTSALTPATPVPSLAATASPKKTLEEQMELPNLFSKTTYTNVYQGVDLEYFLTPTGIKENIVVKEQQNGGYAYAFQLHCGALRARYDSETGCVAVYDPATGEDAYWISAPCMTDENGAVSDQVSLALSGADGSYTLTVTADADWINGDERVFPVRIDPTITVPSANFVLERYVYDGTVFAPYGNTYFFAGTKPDNPFQEYTAYIKFDLPANLPTASRVVGAVLQYHVYSVTGPTPVVIKADAITSSWTAASLASSQPSVWDKALDYTYCESFYQVCQWDITQIVQQWRSGDKNNYGLRLKRAHNQATGQVVFYSSGTSASYYRPCVIISYVNTTGLESYWTTQTASLDRAGTAYVKHVTGDLVYTHSDLATQGLQMPLSVTHVYNQQNSCLSNLATNNIYGLGWSLSVIETVALEQVGNEYAYVYTDGDGTRHYFFEGDCDCQCYYYEQDSSVYLTVLSNGQRRIQDAEGNQSLFDTDGYLIRKEDRNGVYQTYSYSGTGTNKRLATVKDGASQIIYFVYTNGRLNMIYQTASDRPMLVMWFRYDEYNRLTEIEYPGGTVTKFGYAPSIGLLNRVEDPTGNYLALSYSSQTEPIRVNKLRQFSSADELGDNVQFSYIGSTTLVSHRYGTEIGNPVYEEKILLDQAGRTVGITDSEGKTVRQSYSDQVNSVNKLASQSDAHSVVTNLLRNGGAENGTTYWSTSGSGSVTDSSDRVYQGDRSYKMVSTSGSGQLLFTQNISSEQIGTTAYYTVSAYFYADCVGASGGAFVGIRYRNASGSTTLRKSAPAWVSQNWERMSYTFELPYYASNVEAVVGMESAAGTVYFDCVQMEKAKNPSRFNYVENSSFDHSSNWNNGSGSIVSLSAENRKAYQIQGSYIDEKKVSQEFPISINQHGFVTVGGWAKANATAKGIFGIWVELYFGSSDAYLQKEYIPFHPYVTDWQYTCMDIRAQHNYDRIRITLEYSNNLNTAYFDDIQVYLDSDGMTCSYHASGKPEIIWYADGSTETYQYTSNNAWLKKITNTTAEDFVTSTEIHIRLQGEYHQNQCCRSL